MSNFTSRSTVLRATLITLLFATPATPGCNAQTRSTPIPAPTADAPLAHSPGKQTAIFAGGCFWGTQRAPHQTSKIVRSGLTVYSAVAKKKQYLPCIA